MLDRNARYSVYTYDYELCEFTPQEGLKEPSLCVDIFQVKRVLRELRAAGYECWRRGNTDRGHDGDAAVLVTQLTDEDVEFATNVLQTGQDAVVLLEA